MRIRRSAVAVTVPLLLAFAACAPAEEGGNKESGKESTPSASGDPSACAESALLNAGQLVIGTDSPAYDPWFSDNDPANGRGFESAVAYALAERLDIDEANVSWKTVPFDNIFKPGAKEFDFAINQVSISPERAKAVDFSTGYYSAAQAAIVLAEDGAEVTSLADLADLKVGAQTGTTSLTAIREVIEPATQELVFQDTNAAKQALLNGQVDAIIADLPTAFYITAVEIPEAEIVGQFQPDAAEQEQFGLVLEKDSALTTCVDGALDEMRADGTLAAIEDEWLSQVVGVPAIK